MSSLNVSKMIKILENKINTLGNTVKTLENTVKTQGNTIKTQSVMLRNQGETLRQLRLKVPELEKDITNLEKLNKVLTGEVNAIQARIYARAKLERVSDPGKTKQGNYVHYQGKVSNWHNTFHGRHFTEEQIRKMKSGVGNAYAARKAIEKKNRRGVVNNYGTMKTDSLKAVQYAIGRKSDKASSHAPSIKSPSKY